MSLALMSPLAAWAQVDSNTVAVTASRSLSGAPDQIVIEITAGGPLTSTLDDAVSQLQGAGVTSSAFWNVYVPTPSFSIVLGGGVAMPSLNWTFHIGVPFAKAKDTMTALAALAPTLAQKSPPWTLTFSIYGTQTSPGGQPSCSLSDLLADARTRAQIVANAAGLTLGQVLAMSGVSPSTDCTMTVKFGFTR